MLYDLLGRGMDRHMCHEIMDDGGGYSDNSSIGYYVTSKRRINDSTGEVVIRQEVKRRNPGSNMYSDLVDKKL